MKSENVKVVVLGSASAGKTSLLRRFAKGEQDIDQQLVAAGGQDSDITETRCTVGGAFYMKSVAVGTEKVQLHIWDTAGSETYLSITRMYYRNASAGILCYDITNYKSFSELKFWSEELLRNVPECRLYVCGCKLDIQGQGGRQVPTIEAREFAIAKKAAFFETSARSGDNVDALFNRICCDAVDWSFVSITTGNLHEPSERKSFVLTGDGLGGQKSRRKTGQRDGAIGGCAFQQCSTA